MALLFHTPMLMTNDFRIRRNKNLWCYVNFLVQSWKKLFHIANYKSIKNIHNFITIVYMYLCNLFSQTMYHDTVFNVHWNITMWHCVPAEVEVEFWGMPQNLNLNLCRFIFSMLSSCGCTIWHYIKLSSRCWICQYSWLTTNSNLLFNWDCLYMPRKLTDGK